MSRIDDSHNGWLRERLNLLEDYEATGVSPAIYERFARVYKDGRVVVLPCRLGDIVWTHYDSEIIEMTVSKIILDCEDSNTRILLSGEGYVAMLMVWEKDLNKYFWLTRKDAEKAKEGQYIKWND